MQKKLFDAVSEVNPNIAVVLFCGRPLDITDISQKARAVLNMWYPGTMGAPALAEMIFGESAPSGKLSMSFPQTVGQCPISYSFLPTSHYSKIGQPNAYSMRYIDVTNAPLYPFGHGLTYTSFVYSEIVLSSNTLKSNSIISASVEVTNTGNRDGWEIVQLYVHDVTATLISRPLKELKAFKRLFIPAGQTVCAQFEINEQMLKYYNNRLEYISEPGEFELFIGSSSNDCKKAEFMLTV